MREICVWRLLLCNWSIDCKMSFPVMTYCRPQQTRQWFISLLSQKDLQVEIPIPSSFIEMLATKGNGNPLEGLRGRHDMPHYGVWKCWPSCNNVERNETLNNWTLWGCSSVYYPSEMRTPIWNLLYSSMTWNDGRYISPEDVLRQTFQGPPPTLLFHSRETTVGMVVCCRLVVAFTTEAAASCPWALAKQKSLESHDKQVLSWPGMKMLWLSTKHHLIYFRPPVSLLIHPNKFVAS